MRWVGMSNLKRMVEPEVVIPYNQPVSLNKEKDKEYEEFQV